MEKVSERERVRGIVGEGKRKGERKRGATLMRECEREMERVKEIERERKNN